MTIEYKAGKVKWKSQSSCGWTCPRGHYVAAENMPENLLRDCGYCLENSIREESLIKYAAVWKRRYKAYDMCFLEGLKIDTCENRNDSDDPAMVIDFNDGRGDQYIEAKDDSSLQDKLADLIESHYQWDLVEPDPAAKVQTWE